MANNNREVILFALSTCIWCRKAKAWLEEKGIQYQIYHMDLLTGAEREAAMDRIRKYTDHVSYPIVVIDDGESVIQGFHPERLEEELG